MEFKDLNDKQKDLYLILSANVDIKMFGKKVDSNIYELKKTETKLLNKLSELKVSMEETKNEYKQVRKSIYEARMSHFKEMYKLTHLKKRFNDSSKDLSEEERQPVIDMVNKIYDDKLSELTLSELNQF